MRTPILAVLVGIIALSFLAASTDAYAGPCTKDAAKFCKDIKPGEGRILECLKQNRASLKPACKAKLNRVERRQGK